MGLGRGVAARCRAGGLADGRVPRPVLARDQRSGRRDAGRRIMSALRLCLPLALIGLCLWLAEGREALQRLSKHGTQHACGNAALVIQTLPVLSLETQQPLSQLSLDLFKMSRYPRSANRSPGFYLIIASVVAGSIDHKMALNAQIRQCSNGIL